MAIILKVDMEKRRISFGLKPSYFSEEDLEEEDEEDDEDGDEEMEGIEEEEDDDVEINSEEVKTHFTPSHSETFSPMNISNSSSEGV